MTELAEVISILSAGLFLLVGLLTGVWKYLQIVASENARAHPYVDICHRASLMYAFAAILLAKFVEVSQLDALVETLAVSVVLFYFAVAIFTYFLHGLLQDTDNQLRNPHQGQRMGMQSFFMWSLIIGEIGGFLVIFYGVISAVL